MNTLQKEALNLIVLLPLARSHKSTEKLKWIPYDESCRCFKFEFIKEGVDIIENIEYNNLFCNLVHMLKDYNPIDLGVLWIRQFSKIRYTTQNEIQFSIIHSPHLIAKFDDKEYLYMSYTLSIKNNTFEIVNKENLNCIILYIKLHDQTECSKLLLHMNCIMNAQNLEKSFSH